MIQSSILPFNIAERMNHFNVPGIGVSVIREGQIYSSESYGVTEAGTNELINNDSLFHACSISKMITAMGVMKLAQDGVVDLEEDVNYYLKSWQIPKSTLTDNKKVTLLNLLSHQAGFIDVENSFDTYWSCQEKCSLKTHS